MEIYKNNNSLDILRRGNSRDLNADFYKMIACFLIILLHTNWKFYCKPYELNYFNQVICLSINNISSIGVSCFMLISGYFGIKYNNKKIFLFIVKAIFYGSFGYLILVLVGVNNYSVTGMFKSAFSVLLNKNWYLCCYIALIIFSTYINKLLNNLTEVEYKRLIGVVVLILSVVPTLIYYDLPGRTSKDLLQMIMLYIIGSYLKKVDNYSKLSKIHAFNGLILSLLLTETFNLILLFLTGEHKNYFSRDNCIFVILSAVFMWIFIKKINIKCKFISRVAVCSLDIYLLNDAFILPLLNISIYDLVLNLRYFVGIGIIIYAILVLFLSCITAKICQPIICFINNLGEKFIRRILAIRLVKKLKITLMRLFYIM